MAGDKNTGKRMVVAMSGGVDSAVAAALMTEQGYEVIGITLQLHEEPAGQEPPGGPCGGAHVEDARAVARRIGILHHVLDIRQQFFNDVIKKFADSYAKGETPNPCALCNQKIKFGALLQVAKDLGAEALATGHYARLKQGGQNLELHRAADLDKDQSYFLFAIPRGELANVRFPLGGYGKQEIRNLAGKWNLPVASKPDSQDICFVPDGNYAGLVNRFHAEALRPGDIVDEEGNVLGRHEGIINFTIGQRRGLNISDREGENNEPLFVLRLDSKTRQVVVGPRSALAERTIGLQNVNWLGEEVPKEGLKVAVRLRSTQQPVQARYFAEPDNRGRIELETPVFGVAPGQAGVIYDQTRVLGGGWIVPARE